MALRMVIWANLKNKKSVYISIFILMLLISIVFASIISTSLGSGTKMKEALNENGSDLISFINADKLTEDKMDSIRHCSVVESMDLSDSLVTNTFRIGEKTADNKVFLNVYDPNQHEYRIFNDQFTSFVGTKPVPQKGEIFLPVAMRDMYHCEIGDQAVITQNSGEKTFQIAHFIEEPTFGCSMMGVKIAFISQEDYEETAVNSLNRENLVKAIRVEVKDEYQDRLFDAKNRYQEETGIPYIDLYTVVQNESYSYTMLFLNIINGILWAFSLLLFLVVLIIIGHSITSSIEIDYKNYGIFKSSGFTSKQIRFILISQYLFTAVAAMIVGNGISIAVIPLLNKILLPVTGILTDQGLILLPVIGVNLIILLFITLYSFYKSRKVVRISPVQAITGGRGPITFKKRLDLSITSRFPKSLNLKLILKQIVNHMTQYISTILILAILIFFTMTVTAIQQLLSSENAEQLFGGIVSDITVEYPPENINLTDQVMKSIDEKYQITRKIHCEGQYVSMNGVDYLFRIKEKNSMFTETLEGRTPEFENEIMITGVLEEELGLHIGDQVTLKCENTTGTFMITGIYQDSVDAGRNCTILDTGFRTLSPEFEFGSVMISLDRHEKSTECADYLKELYQKEIDAKQVVIIDSYTRDQENMQTVSTAISSITAITYVLVLIFGAVVTFMMCQKRFFQERINLGIYKSVGFTASNLRWQFTFQYVLIVILGCVVGLLLYLGCGDTLLSILFRALGIVHFKTYYTVSLILIPMCYVTACTTVFAYLVAGRIKHVSCKNCIME